MIASLSRGLWPLVIALFASTACGDDDGTGGGAGQVPTGGAEQGGAGGTGGTADPAAPDPTGFVDATKMNVARKRHTATLLADGRVLVTGGDNSLNAMIDSVEVYDPATAAWTELAPLPEARANHTATLLDDGRVLIAGGGTTSAIGLPNGVTAFDTAVIFDTVSGEYEEVAMSAKRADHRAARLADGRVLIMGGATDMIAEECTVIPNCTVGMALDSTEIFDPAANAFSPAGSMGTARYSAVAALLLDGRVMIAGGVDSNTSVASAEIFDPSTDTFSPTADMQYDRLFAAGAVLGTGQLLVAGGKKADVAPQAYTELYDPASDTWTKVGDLSQRRTGAQALTLESGHVLHIGGYNQIDQTAVAAVELFDDATGNWTLIGELVGKRLGFTATLLQDGRVLVCGGVSSAAPLRTCEVSVSE